MGKLLKEKGTASRQEMLQKSRDDCKMKQFMDVVVPGYYLFIWNVSGRCFQEINSFMCDQQRPKPPHKTKKSCIFPSILHGPNVSNASFLIYTIRAKLICWVKWPCYIQNFISTFNLQEETPASDQHYYIMIKHRWCQIEMAQASQSESWTDLRRNSVCSTGSTFPF